MGAPVFCRQGHCLVPLSWYADPHPRERAPPDKPAIMGKSVHCKECGKVYRELDELEDLRDNDSVCLVCNNTIEVADWDRILASFEDDEGDVEDEDDEDWDDDEEESEEDDDLEVDEDLDEDLDEEEDDEEDEEEEEEDDDEDDEDEDEDEEEEEDD